jgi:two-component system OmpR family response regulator
MRILVADDDPIATAILSNTLTNSGIEVTVVNDGDAAWQHLNSAHPPSLAILDWMMPNIDGIELCRRVRSTPRLASTYILLLTCRDSREDLVMGLEAGADDYMAKPFSLQELEARVRALMRRGLGTASNLLKHGPLTFDASGRVAYLNDQMVELSARELSLLEVLLQRAGRLVSKDQLVERLCEWGDEVSNNAIEVYIHRLRKKIEQGPIRIATVRGLGYCLEKVSA